MRIRARQVAIGSGAVALVAAACALVFLTGPGRAEAGGPVQRELLACTDAGEARSRRACIARAVKGERRRVGLERAIATLERAATRDERIAQDCHMALHPIGEAAGRRLLEGERELPRMRPRSFCHEGLVHGMQTAWFSGASQDQLARRGGSLCGSGDVQAEWACGHSLGHAVLRRAAGAPDGANEAVPTFDHRRVLAQAISTCAAAERASTRVLLDFDAFLSTCAKGAMMELTLLDQRAGTSSTPADLCGEVEAGLVRWCEGFLALRVDLTTDALPTSLQLLRGCEELAASPVGRADCVRITVRGTATRPPCGSLERAALRRVCSRAWAGRDSVDPSTTPAS